MESIRKIVVLVVVIAVVAGLGPLVLRVVLPSWAFNRDLASGGIRWQPVYGVLVERDVTPNLCEQYVVGWVGPGTVQVVQYANTPDSDLLSNDGMARQRVGTAEERVTINLARVYSVARSPDEFPIVIRQQYDGRGFEVMPDTGGDALETPYGYVFFAEHAAVRLENPYRWGFKTLPAGSMLYLDFGKWRSIDQGGLSYVQQLPEGSYAGFTVLTGLGLSPPQATQERIELLKSLMSRSAGGDTAAMPSDDYGNSIQFVRAPESGALQSGMARMLYTSDWAFPMPKSIDLAERLAGEDPRVATAYSAGWGYSLPAELSPANNSVWFLRCLEQTEIAVPYSPPF